MAAADRIAVACLLAVGSWAGLPAAPVTVFSINEASIAQMRKQHPLASAEVDDPVYNRKQRYQGFLVDVLKNLGQGRRSDTGLYVRFRCKDGYLPIMPLARAREGKGLIAIRDARASRGEDWQPAPGKPSSLSLSPSYLVWVSPAGDPEEYPWPFQMVAIELVSSSDALAGLDGNGSKAGHDLFVTHCLKCHAINGIGGTFGPELNSPCSVTEYWNPQLLSRFIGNAGSIRAGSRMPTFDSLRENDTQVIVDYLRSMAGHKKPGAACPPPRPRTSSLDFLNDSSGCSSPAPTLPREPSCSLRWRPAPRPRA